jgi:hypothetical protein
LYEDGLRDESRRGDTARRANPDIHALVHGLFNPTGEPAVALKPEGAVRDTAGESRCKEETHAEERARGGCATEGECYTDHQDVVEPVIEAEGAPVEECMIQMEGVAAIDRGPRYRQGGSLGGFRGEEGVTNIDRREGHDSGVVDHVDGIVGALEVERGEGAIECGEDCGDCGRSGESLEERERICSNIHPCGMCRYVPFRLYAQSNE